MCSLYTVDTYFVDFIRFISTACRPSFSRLQFPAGSRRPTMTGRSPLAYAAVRGQWNTTDQTATTYSTTSPCTALEITTLRTSPLSYAVSEPWRLAVPAVTTLGSKTGIWLGNHHNIIVGNWELSLQFHESQERIYMFILYEAVTVTTLHHIFA